MDLDEFSDDDLDAITDSTLLELERNALAARPKGDVVGPPQSRQIHTYNVPGLRKTANSSWRPPRPRQSPQRLVQCDPPLSAPAPPSSDYGLDEEDVIDLDEPSMVIQPSAVLPSRSRNEQASNPPSRSGTKVPLDAETEAAFAAADAELGAHVPGQWTAAPHLQPEANLGIEASRLQARIAELEAEQARLLQSERDARNAAMAKQGEISIVRANQERSMKEYERRIAVMQKLHADETARQKAELEVGRKEREKMETDNRFLQHDLAQEAEKTKRLTGPGKARAAAIGNGRETPRKQKRSALGDGFDDHEVRMVSPSKSNDKSREQTPKVGAKRKRVAQDSPIAPLSFTQLPHAGNDKTGEPVPGQLGNQHVVGEPPKDYRDEFIQRALNHIPYEGHERSVESLAKHVFPSKSSKSLSALLLDGLVSPSIVTATDHPPLKLCRVALKLWRRCLEESYYLPLYLLLDLICFSVKLEPPSIISQLVSEAVPLCITSIDLIAMPTAKASKDPGFAAGPDQKKTDELAEQIDVDAILELLQELCEATCLSDDGAEVFWRNMEFTFTLLMLHKAQPMSQIITALQILSTSILATTFGPVSADPAMQSKQEYDIIDRLTSLLLEAPEVPKDEPAYEEEEIVELRTETLKTLKAMCFTDHSRLLLIKSRNVIGRLIYFLDAQICKLYACRPSIGLPPSSDLGIHDLVAKSINIAILILYHLIKTSNGSIDFHSKASAIKGGWHKFIVCMTRIAFADRLVLDRGLDADVVEAAHTILDDILSPEEGEAIIMAIETPRGTKSTHTGDTTEKNTQSDEDDGEGVG